MNNDDEKYSVHEIPIDKDEKRQKEQDAIVENLLKNAEKDLDKNKGQKEKHNSGGVIKTLAGITATAVIGGAVAMYALNKEDEPDYHTINFMYNIDEEAGESKNVEVGIKVGDVLPKKIRGYRFMGWYKDDTFIEPYNNDEIVPLNATLYGKYMKILKVNFPESAEGYYITIGENKEPVLGENYSFSIFMAESHSKSKPKVYVNLLNNDSQEPYELLPNESGLYVIDDMKGDYNINIEGVAVNTYRVVFKVGKDIVSDGIVKHGEYPEALRPADNDERLLKEHQTFVGWGITTASEDNTIIENVGEYKIVADTVFHAKYEHTIYDMKFVMIIDDAEHELVEYAFKLRSGEYISNEQIIPVGDRYPASDPKYYYDFKGWSTKKDGTTSDVITDFTTLEISSNTTFYAVYSAELHKYALNIKANDFIDVTVVVSRDGNQIILSSSTPSEELYLCYGDIFEIACDSQDGHKVGSVLVTGGVFINDDNMYQVNGEGVITISVSESIVVHTVTFMNGDSLYETIDVNYGDTISKPNIDPIKTDTEAINFEFMHWSSSINGEPFDFDTPITKNLTLKAVYSEEYYKYMLDVNWHDNVDTIITITRGSDTLTWTKDTPEEELYFHYGDLFSIENTAHIGYTFDNIEVSGAVTKIGDNTYQVLSDRVYVTINAHINEYSVTFVNDDITYHTTSLEFGSKVTLPSDNPTKESNNAFDFTFSHWAIKVGDDFIEVNFDTYTISDNVVFYAVYNHTNIEYIVNIEVSNIVTSFEIKVIRGTNVVQTITSIQPIKIYYGDKLDISYQKTDGYTLNIVGNGIKKEDGRYLVDGSTKNATINITSEIVACTVTFYDDDGITILQTSNVDYGTIVTPPANPSKESDDNKYIYTFSHWSTQIDGTPVDNFEIVSTSVKYYAVYNVEYVEFNLNVTYAPHISTIIKIKRDGIPTGYTNQEVIKIRPDDQIIIENTPHTGYKDLFEITGNYREENGCYYVNNSGDVTIVVSEELLEFTVTFISNGSQYGVNQTVKYNQFATAPANPTAETGYKFVYWSTSENGSAVDILTFNITENTTFHAVFEVNTNVSICIRELGKVYNYEVYMEVGQSVYSEVTRLIDKGIIHEVNDMNTCGWFTDSGCTYPMDDDAVVADGMKLYSWMATLDKISITNGRVSAVVGTSHASGIIIPRKDSEGNYVTEIAENGFADCNMQKVVLSSSIKRINKKAFYQAYALNEVNIPTTVEYIGAYAFATSKTDGSGGTIYSTIPIFGDPVGWYAGNTQINPDDIINFPGALLVVNYNNVEWNKIGETQTILTLNIDGESTNYAVEKGANVLNAIDSLNLVVNGIEISDITTCGWFTDENLLISVADKDVVKNNITLYTKIATTEFLKFEDFKVTALNTSIEGEVVIPRKYLNEETGEEIVVQYVYSYAFDGCSKITNIVLPSSLEYIYHTAFRECYSLTSINIPTTVKSISDAFALCTSLTAINVADEHEYFSSVGGVLFDKNQTKLISYPAGITSESYTIPNTVETLYSYAFAGNNHLKNVIFENSNLIEIDSFTFFSCESLSSISIPSSVKTLNMGAFNKCYSLQTVKIESDSQLETIDIGTFEECKKLTSIYIPATVSLISMDNDKYMHPFVKCFSLTEITVDENNQFFSSENGVLFNKNKTILICYPAGKNDISSYVIPSTVTEVSKHAFWGNGYLNEISIPKSVEFIGVAAFNNTLITNAIFEDIYGWEAKFNSYNSTTGATFDYSTVSDGAKIAEYLKNNYSASYYWIKSYMITVTVYVDGIYDHIYYSIDRRIPILQKLKELYPEYENWFYDLECTSPNNDYDIINVGITVYTNK